MTDLVQTPTPAIIDYGFLPIRSVYISPDRQRKKINEPRVSELAVSIQAHGLIEPIVVEPLNRELYPMAPAHCIYHLVAGYRRLLAHALIKKPEIAATLRSNLTALEAEEIELDENLLRENLEWQDEVSAKARILKIR